MAVYFKVCFHKINPFYCMIPEQEEDEVRMQTESQEYVASSEMPEDSSGMSGDGVVCDSPEGLDALSKELLHVNAIIEKVFFITLNKGKRRVNLFECINA